MGESSDTVSKLEIIYLLKDTAWNNISYVSTEASTVVYLVHGQGKSVSVVEGKETQSFIEKRSGADCFYVLDSPQGQHKV